MLILALIVFLLIAVVSIACTDSTRYHGRNTEYRSKDVDNDIHKLRQMEEYKFYRDIGDRKD